ncbi:hypothetical protein D915_002317 [Fasciola hepatica]|uniref:Uncharacterized protein n=1 Tax=Fasciola hepatica TaxID=6192 RepID=A0A4E0RW33_FASHE|nr:hypothetical protein D915_002317 [Fasciola hepatica]
MEPERSRQPEELELLWMRMKAKTDENLRSTPRVVRLPDRSQKVGAATMENAFCKREQLRPVDPNRDVIHEDLRVAVDQLEDSGKCGYLYVLPRKEPRR